jgi:hypothetical protein
VAPVLGGSQALKQSESPSRSHALAPAAVIANPGAAPMEHRRSHGSATCRNDQVGYN